ncbi:MAG: 30S ribosomal protein S3 [Candidatus Woesearchaeota archaeon]
MIEKKFIEQRMKEFMIEEHVSSKLNNVGHSSTQLKRTPLGEKIIITAARPGFVVGRKGENIKAITEYLKGSFELENPQIEINEVENVNLDAKVVAERIASTLERFGTNRFKGIGHRVMDDVMKSGALGIEILISGKIPGARAKRWRFYQGYLKKCGDIAISGVRQSLVNAKLKTGIIGIQVRLMPPDIELPDSITLRKEEVFEETVEEIEPEESEVTEESTEATEEAEIKEEEKKASTKKASAKKKKTKKTKKK